MNILSMGARIISRSSPALLIAGGAALALSCLPIRRGLHTVAVKATKGALVVGDEVKNLTSKMRTGASGIVKEARRKSGCPCHACRIKSIGATAKIKGHHMAVAATAGLLSMKDKAKAVHDGLAGIVDEAKQRIDKNAISIEESAAEIPHDGLEASITDIGPDSSPRKRRIVATKLQR